MLDPVSQHHFDQLRERHFPAALNMLPAHVTMFHHLPGEHRAEIEALLAAQCQATAAGPFRAERLRFLGRGTGCDLLMPHVAALRARLVQAWLPWLTPQDRQAWKPHVTIQNKVPPAEAKQTHAMLQAGFSPFEGQAVGLTLWAYLGGPWQHLRGTTFASTLLEP